MALTLSEAIRGFIIGDATLATKVGTAVYPMTLPQGPPDCAAVVRIISSASWRKLDGATDQAQTRIEVTFWCKSYRDSEVLANRLRIIVKGFNGIMGTGGVALAVFQTMGPRSLFNPDNRFYGSQIDIMAIVDLSTASGGQYSLIDDVVLIGNLIDVDTLEL